MINIRGGGIELGDLSQYHLCDYSQQVGFKVRSNANTIVTGVIEFFLALVSSLYRVQGQKYVGW